MREKILLLIENNAKLTAEDIADILMEEPERVASELEAMEKEHIICGYHTLINWDKTEDERVDALIEVKVTPQRGMGFDSIAERIYQYEEVDALYLMSGGFDHEGGREFRRHEARADGIRPLHRDAFCTEEI